MSRRFHPIVEIANQTNNQTGAAQQLAPTLPNQNLHANAYQHLTEKQQQQQQQQA